MNKAGVRKAMRGGGFGLVVLLGALALLAGGCGGKKTPPLTKADYNKQMTAVGRALSSSINGLSSVTSASVAAKGLATVQVDLRAAVDKMKKITPPAAVKDAHEKLIVAVGDFADALDGVITKLKAGNLAALTQVTSLKSFTEIQDAATAIQKAGYSIGG